MLQAITQGEWGGEHAKLNQMFNELSTYTGTSYIPIWEDWWANIYLDLNSNFTTLYTALGGTGRQDFLFEESWGDVRGKMNTMFPYLYNILEYEVEFEVYTSDGDPDAREGVDINVSYYLNYVSSAVTDINPSTVTFSSNYFTIPLGVEEFTFYDGETLMEAVNFGGWSVSEYSESEPPEEPADPLIIESGALVRGTNEGSTASFSTNYHNLVGTNFMIVFLGTHDQNITACTYDGVAMTLQESITDQDARGWMYTMADPPEGDNTLEVTLTSDALGVIAYSLSGVTGIKDTASLGTNSTDNNPNTLTLDSVEDGLVIDYVRWRNSAQDGSSGEGQTVIDDDSPTRQLSSYKDGEATSTDMEFSLSGTGTLFSHLAISLE